MFRLQNAMLIGGTSRSKNPIWYYGGAKTGSKQAVCFVICGSHHNYLEF